MFRLKDLLRAGRTRISLLGSTNPTWYIGWVGHANLGDEAIYQATRHAFGPCRLFHCRPRESPYLSKSGSPHKYPLAVLGGGTLIGDMGHHDVFKRAIESSRTTVVFGTGVEDPAFWPGRNPTRYDLASWKSLLDRCAYVGVRGPRSKAYLQQVGVECEILGDPACMLVESTAGDAPRTNRDLGLNVGKSKYMLGNNDTVFEALVTFATRQRAAGWKITLYVVYPKDLPMARALADRVGLPRTDIRAIYYDPARFTAAVRQHNVFVGFKLHAVILAYCAGVPSLMIEYRPKCRDFMESIDAGDHVIGADAIAPERISAAVADLERNAPELLRRTSARLRHYRDLQLATARRIVAEQCDPAAPGIPQPAFSQPPHFHGAGDKVPQRDG